MLVLSAKKNMDTLRGSFYKYLRKNGNFDLWSRMGSDVFIMRKRPNLCMRVHRVHSSLSSWSELIPFRRPRLGRREGGESLWTFRHFYMFELAMESRDDEVRRVRFQLPSRIAKWWKRWNNRRGNIREGSKGRKRRGGGEWFRKCADGIQWKFSRLMAQQMSGRQRCFNIEATSRMVTVALELKKKRKRKRIKWKTRNGEGYIEFIICCLRQ